MFVKGLPALLTEEELNGHFAKVGKIDKITIVRDKETSLGTGIAYVKYS